MDIKTIIEQTNSPIKKWVAEDILEDSGDYSSVRERIEGIIDHGCISGAVTSAVMITSDYYNSIES